MRIVRADLSDPATTRECFEVLRASDAVDDPAGPPWSLRRLRGWLAYPWEPAEAWLAVDEATGGFDGWCFLMFPQRENRDRVYFWLAVRPSSRRRGIGTALLRHAAGRTAAEGRTALGGEVWQGGAGAAFAERYGATPGMLGARRVLALGTLPVGRIASLRSQAAQAAAGYSLVRWDGRTPEEYLAKYAEVENA